VTTRQMPDPSLIGVVGANGFIGSRIVEVLHLEAATEVRPIVRTAASLARSARFAVEERIADALDERALCAAFDGCDVVVHAVAGDRRAIIGSVAPTYRAAQAAAVRRLVYLSSASVHGQAPAPGTDEGSPLSTRQPIAYNNSKVWAEQRLRRLRRGGKVEIVLLRPGIVFGPRSYWTGGLADEILAGQAALVRAGEGICNSIYVDNLVHAVRLAATAAGVDGEAFLLGDQETVTWKDFFRPVLDALGMTIEQIPDLEPPLVPRIWSDPIAYCRSTERGAAILAGLPPRSREVLRAMRGAWRQLARSRPSPWLASGPRHPNISLEKALLQQCQVKLPLAKARTILGYEPIVSFAEGCRRSVAWLEFAGYPVVGGTTNVPAY
jgi:nucleoside-diphosphate-sugar epimerase